MPRHDRAHGAHHEKKACGNKRRTRCRDRVRRKKYTAKTTQAVR